MAVYVDDMYRYPMGRYGRMKMSHMVADTHDELMRMADRIGLDRRWLQNAGTRREHFDVSMTKRREAIAAGALTVSTRELVELTHRCVTESLHVSPGDLMLERCPNPVLPGKDICQECEWAVAEEPASPEPELFHQAPPVDCPDKLGHFIERGVYLNVEAGDCVGCGNVPQPTQAVTCLLPSSGAHVPVCGPCSNGSTVGEWERRQGPAVESRTVRRETRPAHTVLPRPAQTNIRTPTTGTQIDKPQTPAGMIL